MVKVRAQISDNSIKKEMSQIYCDYVLIFQHQKEISPGYLNSLIPRNIFIFHHTFLSPRGYLENALPYPLLSI
jgi:hypothetical protein